METCAACGQAPVQAPVFTSLLMRDLIRQAAAFADCEQPVLIQGETGVGKEYIARLMHAGHTTRQAGPLVIVNCGAVPEGLFESLFFGHARGAFTGAQAPHKGYFEQAEGGTLFLDEIGELPLRQQVKLLRVLEDRAVTRVGAEKPIAVDVRLVSATHQDLRAMTVAARFRADLYYRIAVVELKVPNLAERGGDERRELFISLLGPVAEEPPPWLLDQVGQALLPGNVRQLRNIAERARTVYQQLGAWDRELIARVFHQEVGLVPGPHSSKPGAEDERSATLAALKANQWKRQATADQLGITRKTLWRRMARHGL